MRNICLFNLPQKLHENVVVEKTLSYVMDAITLTRHKLEGKVPLIGFTGAPVSLFFRSANNQFILYIIPHYIWSRGIE